jgi:hypothetical protein
MSRQQRHTHSLRCNSHQIRAVLMHGPRYAPVEYVPLVKVTHGNADPDR